MKFQQYLTETIDNYFTKDEKLKYAEKIFDIIQKSYAPVGGIHGNGFQSVEDMINKIPMWKVFRRGDDIKVVMMYKDKGGRKRVAIATDGTKESKVMLAKMLQDEYRTGRSFGEVSDNSLRFIKRQFSENEFKKFVIPVDVVKQLLPNDEIEDIDGYFYTRNIGGHHHTKLMLGNPNAPEIRKYK